MKFKGKLSDFDFELPSDLIATRPASPRSASRLLVASADTITDRHVNDLEQYLRPGDRLILNNTKVIPARLSGLRLRQSDQGETRARVEITLLSPDQSGCWLTLAKPGKRLKLGEIIEFGVGLEAIVRGKPAGQVTLEFNLSGDAFDAVLAKVGKMPLPPYIATLRAVDARDNTDYQTVFAERKGAVAAPTASLHFDEALLARLSETGVCFSRVTLHVGAGTFLPVKVDDLSNHKMHSEWGEVTQQAADEINRTRREGGRIIPVGTTALRVIETAATPRGEMRAFRGDTDIFIAPGYRFRATDALMTNFHLPSSTLFILVSALMGRDRMGEIYAHAKATNYRFFSYGDSSLLLPGDGKLR